MGNIIGGFDTTEFLAAVCKYGAEALNWAFQDPINGISLGVTAVGIYTSAVTLQQKYSTHKLKKSIMGIDRVKKALASKSWKERRAFMKKLLRLQNQDITEANITKALSDFDAEKTEVVGKTVKSDIASPINGQQVVDAKAVETHEKVVKGIDMSKISSAALLMLLAVSKMTDEEAKAFNDAIDRVKETGQSKVVCDGLEINLVKDDSKPEEEAEKSIEL